MRYLSEETRKSAVSTLLNMKKHSPSVMELVPDHLRGGNWAKYMHTLLDPATSPPYHSVITERRDINFSGKKSSQNKIGSDEDESDAAILDPAFVPLRLRLLSRTSLSSVAHKTTPTPILEDEDTKSSDVDIERLLQHAGSNSDTEFDGEDDEDDDNNNQDEEDSGEGEGDGDGDDDYSNSDEDEESIATAPQLGNCADNVQIELSSDYAFEDDAGSGDTTDAASSESLMARVGNEAPLSINSISAKQSEAVVSRRSVDSNQLMTLADTKTPSTSATAVPRRSRCLNAPTGLLLQIGASQQKPMLSHIKPAYDMNLPRLSHEDRIAPSPNGRGLFGRLSTSPMQSSILQAPRLKSSKISISPVNSSSSSSPHVDWQTGSDHKRTRDAIEELMMNTTDGFGSVKHTTSTVATNAQTFQRRRSQNNRLCGLTIDTDDN